METNLNSPSCLSILPISGTKCYEELSLNEVRLQLDSSTTEAPILQYLHYSTKNYINTRWLLAHYFRADYLPGVGPPPPSPTSHLPGIRVTPLGVDLRRSASFCVVPPEAEGWIVRPGAGVGRAIGTVRSGHQLTMAVGVDGLDRPERTSTRWHLPRRGGGGGGLAGRSPVGGGVY